MTAGIAQEYRGERLGFKGYPCGLVAHPALDALKTLAGSYLPEDVLRVRVYGDEHLRVMTEPREVRRNPRNFVDAQFSLPWAFACTILDGTVQLRHFEPAVLSDKRYRLLAELVDIKLDGPRASSRVELDLRDGRTLRSEEVTLARGHPDNPLSNAEIGAVFMDCLSYAPNRLAIAKAARVPDLLFGQNNTPGTDDLLALLRPA